MARSRWAPGAPALAGAAQVIDAVAFRGQSADAALPAFDRSTERSAVRAIALGTMRWYLRLAPALEELLTRPAGVPGLIRSLLAATAHQVEYSRNAPEASVHAAVDAARILGAARSSGLVNAVLRRFVAERGELLARVDTDLARRTAHPPWLVARIAAAWPDRCTGILEANNGHPPMTLRIDLSRSTAAAYRAQLVTQSIDSLESQWMASAVTLVRPSPVSALPGFKEGLVSVQDAGAQLAAVLLAAEPGQRVLDACAAPGGKTGHILEQLGQGADVTAVDIDAGRLERTRENLARLGRRAHLAVADMRVPGGFPDGGAFDRVLVDAPCSASGVIRRHPDIKLLRRAGDLAALAATQLAILRCAVQLLARGGRILYSTCSVLPEEGEEIVRQVLGRGSGLRAVPMPPAATRVPGALDRDPGLQLLPGAEAGTDGFYYACLEKTTAGA